VVARTVSDPAGRDDSDNQKDGPNLPALAGGAGDVLHHSGALEGASWSYALDPADRFEAVFVALTFPFMGIPVVFAVAFVVSFIVQSLSPRQSGPNSARAARGRNV